MRVLTLLQIIGVGILSWLLLFNYETIGNTANESTFLIYGYIRDKNGVLSDYIPVSLINLNTGEELINISHNGGFYTFDLAELERGWSDGDEIKLLTSYLDPDDEIYYWKTVTFNINLENDSYQINLTADRLGTRATVERDLPKVVSPNSSFSVNIAAIGVGSSAAIWEKIPQGFLYKNCTLPEDNQVKYFPENNTIVFIILFDQPYFSYNLTAPSAAGEYEFTGFFIDFSKNEHDVTGDSTLSVYDFSAEIACTQERLSGGNMVKVRCTPQVTGGNSPYTYRWDMNGDGEYDVFQRNAFYSYETAGNYTIVLTVTDVKGAETLATKEIMVYTKLEVFFNGDTTVERGELTWLNASSVGAVPPVDYKWDLNNDGVYEYQGARILYSFENVGDHIVSLMATDSGDPPDTDVYDFVIHCRDTKLASPVCIPADESVLRDSAQRVYLIYKEEVSIINSTLDGEEILLESPDNITFESNVVFSLTEGKHVVTVVAVDDFGNKNFFNSTFTVDFTPPHMEIITPNEIKKTSVITVDAFDNQTSINMIVFELIRDGEVALNYTSTEPPYQLDIDPEKLDEGNYTLTVTAYDEAGNILVSSTNVTVEHPGGYETPYLMIGYVFAGIIGGIFIGYLLYYYKRKRYM
ncbi:MAG TPA: hypothetical protein EYP23_04780 [Thermoplasmata archaeon]|nr:hypothetical protein [Thermoplasmata archaeon]